MRANEVSRCVVCILVQLVSFTTFAQSYVYVSLKNEDKLAIYSEEENSGLLTFIDSHEVEGGPASIAFTADKSRVYIARRNAKKISCYAVSKETGKLTFLSEISAVDNPVYIALDKTDGYLLTAYFGASKIAIYQVTTDGSLIETPIFEKDTPANPHAINVGPYNYMMYVTCMGGDRVLQYYFNEETGLPTAMAYPEIVTNDNTGPRHFVIDSEREHLYVANEVASSVTNYSISKSGYLEEIETFSTLPEGYSGSNKCADIHITPNGKFLYVTNRGNESIAAYSIEKTSISHLSLIGIYDTEETPREMAIDAAGKYLFAVGESSGMLQSYTIDQSTGELMPLQNISVGSGPAWIEVIKVGTETAVASNEAEEKNVTVSPNPFAQTARITVNKKYGALIGIFNTEGKLVFKPENVSAEGRHNTYNWSGESYWGKVCFGQYLALVKSNAGTEAVKLLYQP